MCSQQMALVSVAIERSSTWNEGSAEGETQSNEMSLDRITAGKRVARPERPVMQAVDVGGNVMLCEFDCGPPMPRTSMINKRNARSPCWVCHACYSSMKS